MILRHPRVGILGGGQLGRMIALAARPLGVDVDVYAPGPMPPAAAAADRWYEGEYADLDLVREFARGVDVVTCEFENVPARTAHAAAEHARVAPHPDILAVAQDRVREKQLAEACGVPVAEYVAFAAGAEAPAEPAWSGPAVLKTASGGYDGKGQSKVASFDEARRVWEQWGRPAAILERFVDFVGEISVLVARRADGETAVYDPFHNVHRDHILDVTTMPAPMAAAALARAQEKAVALAERLDVVGLLCVEMFLLEGDHLLVNEIAPRPHNSGHITMDACVTGQFEQLLRAILGWPLGSVAMRAPAAASANLLGDLWAGVPAGEALDPAPLLDEPTLKLHLYGKHEPRPGRKMGHVTALAPTVRDAVLRVERARDRLRGREA